MEYSLLITTLISSAIFIPLAIVLTKINAKFNPSLRKPTIFVYGGATWSVIAIFQYILLQIINLITSSSFAIANESTIGSFVVTQETSRTPLFWYIFIAAVVGQIILYQGSLKTFHSDSAWEYTIFGLGWGLSEYVQRFLFFGGNSTDLQIYLILYTLGIGAFIGATLIRIRENSKFIMFAALLKFFAEIGIFGELGYNGLNASFTELYAILGLTVAMAGLSMITRKFPLKDD